MTGEHPPLGVFVRGVAMGIVEVIPGVSGGTIAFITGIYERLLGALASLSFGSLRAITRGGAGAAGRLQHLAFLAVLGLGMALGYLVTARVIGFLLDHHGLVVWGFFFGLIAGSVLHLGRQLGVRFAATFGLVGLAGGLLLASLAATQADASYVRFFVGGALAVGAWMLPGVSGAFVLLLLGLYEPFVGAVNGLRVDILAAAGAGMAGGLLLFAKGVSWLLRRFRRAVLAFLTGLMSGSLLRLWPWRADDTLLAPAGYRLATGDDPMVWAVALAALVGLGCTGLVLRSGRTAHD